MSAPLVDRMQQQAALLEQWVAVRAEINRAEARASDLLAARVALMDDDVADQPQHRDAIWRSMIAEHCAAVPSSRGAVERAFDDARFLSTGDYPLLEASFRTGSVTASHVHEILHAAAPVREAVQNGVVEADTMALYEAATVVFAESEAPSRTRTHAREVAAALAGSTITERHERALAERTVTVRSVGDGLALLQVVLPEHLAIAIHDRLTQLGRIQTQNVDQNPFPVLPVDEDALQDKLDNDPALQDDPALQNDSGLQEDLGDESARVPDSDLTVVSTPGTDSGSGTDSGTDTGFGTDTGTSTGQDFYDGLAVPPDNAPFGDDVDAYWDFVEQMISDGPTIIRLPSDQRTLDQIRTDVLTDLLLTATPSEDLGTGMDNITATVQVTVSANTLLGDDDRPGQLDGNGELHPEVARTFAGRSTAWTRLFLDPTGQLTATDTYMPTAGIRRFLQARDQHCRFPGCRMPIHRTELDHNHDHALGGPTSLDNLAHLCKTHHALKHPDIPEQHRWRARQLPGGDLQWTAPNGSTYADAAPRRVMFVPSPEAAPTPF
ncbi:HNH endonuclease signature motif containing protein [Microbacterium esteraromaticum]|uniref:HNH endonuclease signature motif containing protein n=1 Tax=Microbacterium esteraromaticum TaxID=57043 RepID=UPI001C97BB22|nr:HNH endonuclease signature motif containing protein [Microbacterium esteraromaticum]MBY6062371.1 HNH endonuclease [Microbacterium esteraromaticum]